MTFLNKKEDVIDIRLTAYGKKLLSKGGFKPEYYAFFDDGVAYKRGSEKQNESQLRIKQDLTPATQVEVAGVESRFDIETNKIVQGQRDLYEKVEETQDPMSNSKLLKYQLASQQLLTRELPSINLTMLATANINVRQSSLTLTSSGLPSISAVQNDSLVVPIPQLSIEPEYVVHVDRTERSDIPPSLLITDEDEDLDLMSNEVRFLDNTRIVIKDEKVIFSVIEDNVEYTNENFEVEVYEVIEENSKEQLIPIRTMEEMLKRFVIKTDESVDGYALKRRNQRNIFGQSRELTPEPHTTEGGEY
jgi:hypothetical protein